MNQTDLLVQDLSHWSNAISNVAVSRYYITEQYNMWIAWRYIAVDKRDFCSRLIDFTQFDVPFKVVATVDIANWLRLVKKFIEEILRIEKFWKVLGPLTMRHQISEIFLLILLIFINF